MSPNVCLHIVPYSLICTATTSLAPAPPHLYLVRHHILSGDAEDNETSRMNVLPACSLLSQHELACLPCMSSMWLTCARVRARVCVCLVLDFSVANPRAGLGGPSGDIFAADITSPERPLIRSQSFHNSPGKWPPAPRRGHEEASHCLLFQNTEE